MDLGINQNIISNLPSVFEFYNHKYVKYTEWRNLVLFHYTNECTYDKAWDNVTLNARGIIFNKVTKELIARPWKKFFNLSEMISIHDDIQNNPFYTLDKWDGSMGILFNYEDEYYVATKGSFVSDQAIWATEWVRKYINLHCTIDVYTYLFEIIYPENKIVVDYRDMEDLILTGVIRNENGKEVGPNELNDWANILNVKCAMDHSFESLENLSYYCKTLPSQKEGFVITFPKTGLKLKVKGDEYLRIHKIISNLTPLAFYEAWDVKEKTIPSIYLQKIPEEFRKFTDEMYGIVNKMHQDLYNKVNMEYEDIVFNHEIVNKEDEVVGFNLTIKEFAIECQNNHKENMSLLINMFKDQKDKLWENIHKRVRPTSNILPTEYKVKCDIHGRLERLLDDGN